MAKSSTIADAIKKAGQDIHRQSIKAALADLGPNTTVGELIDSLDGTDYIEPFWSLTLAEVREATGGSRSTARASVTSPTDAPRKKSGPGKKWYTRTDEGREAIDAAVSEFLQAQGEPVGAEDVRAKVGGNAAQIRQSMARLIEAKKVSKKGQKRSTRYGWKGK